jgi:hypothetical protein
MPRCRGRPRDRGRHRRRPPAPGRGWPRPGRARRADDEPWWSPRRAADFGGRPRPRSPLPVGQPVAPVDQPWTSERIAVDRAHVLRRLGRYGTRLTAWQSLTYGRGRTPVVAASRPRSCSSTGSAIRPAALVMAERGLALAIDDACSGCPSPRLETNLAVRRDRSDGVLRRAAEPAATDGRVGRCRAPRAYPAASRSARIGPASASSVA